MKLKDWIIIILILINKLKIIIMPYDIGAGAAQTGINTAQGALGALVGQVFAGMNDTRQINQQGKLNEMSFDINNRMAEENYKRQMRLWNDTGYAAQKAQMEKAGLNPALMYGMSGGGGQTVAATPAQGVSGSQSPSGGGEMMGGMAMMLNTQLMQAQKENIEAQTEKTRAETGNLPLTVEQIKASTGNIKADTILKEANAKLSQIEGQYQSGTLEQRIANVSNDASRIQAEAQSSMTQANIDRATQETVIKQYNQNYLNSIMQNKAIQQAITESAARIHKTNQEIETIIKTRFQSGEYLMLAQQGQNNAQNNANRDNMYRSISQETGMGEDVIKMIGGGMIGAGIKGMPNAPRTEDTYGEYDGNYYETHKKSY